METIAGPIEFEKNVVLANEVREEKDNWYIEWDPSFTSTGSYRSRTRLAFRQFHPIAVKFIDRNDKAIAINGTGIEIGVVPEQFDVDANAEKLADILGTTSDYISKQLNQSWVQPDYFVPIKTISIYSRRYLR